jgi:hypothetical protein
MIGPVDDVNLIAGADITFDDYSQVSTGSQRLSEAAREQLIVHPNSKPPARDPWLRDLKNGRADLPALADERIINLNPFRREIFAKLTMGRQPADLLSPPPCVFDSVGIDSLFGPAMCPAIRLVVSGEIHTSGCNATNNR